MQRAGHAHWPNEAGKVAMVLWMASIAVSVCLLVISAAVGATDPVGANIHLFIAGLVSTAMALLAISETRKLIQSGASQMIVAASLTRFMGLIWAWAALVISITYSTGILEWSSWWQYFLGLIVLSGLCLFLSSVLGKDGETGAVDEHMLQASRYIAVSTLLLMVTAALVFGISRINALPSLEQDIWAAQNVFVFGALALSAISTYLLKASVNEAE